MSPQGVPGAVLFFALCLAFVAGVVVLDVWLHRRGGDEATITDGVRWLSRHLPWTTHALAFLLGALLGFLCCHFFAVPLIQ